MKSQRSKPSASMFEPIIRPLGEVDLADAPLANLLVNAAQEESCSFHMPGHNAGYAFAPDLAAKLFRSDTTELTGTDDLNDPKGPVLMAQSLAAEAFGAQRTWFLTGGATQGIQALMYACCGRGGRLLIGPATHRSVLHTAALLDIELKMISVAEEHQGDRLSQLNYHNGLQPGPQGDEKGSKRSNVISPLPIVTVPELKEALRRLAEVDKLPDAVLLISPDYYGAVAPVAGLAEVAHKYDIPLIIDEAHGAHFAFAKGYLPQCALLGGADAVVQSAHKTLPALTPAAMLHLGRGQCNGIQNCCCDLPLDSGVQQDNDNDRSMESTVSDPDRSVSVGKISPQRVHEGLLLFRTSSPSLMMAATIDLARSYLVKEGVRVVLAQLAAVDYLYQNLDQAYIVSTDETIDISASIEKQLTTSSRVCAESKLDLNNWSSYSVTESNSARQFEPINASCSINQLPQKDPLRVVIDTRRIAPAPAVAKFLSQNNIEVEFADLCRLVLIVSLFTTRQQIHYLVQVLNDFAVFMRQSANEMVLTNLSQYIAADRALVQAWMRPHPQVDGGYMLDDGVEIIPLARATGRVLARPLTPYPPGIPMLWPGDCLSHEDCERLLLLLEAGLDIQGVSRNCRNGVPVVQC
ncbi:MAG: aminotransferase class I/II-fold pyridoxal phosphate-dependent enzyme [Fastidiosipilaceae bacterium]|nr:hypothetical protein [Clostridiaceae bacterium]